MQIGWLIPTVGIFGAVREMVEVSNALAELGHRITIYHPEGTPCAWLDCRAGYGTVADATAAELDVLIGIIDWQPELFSVMHVSPARWKAVCLMGFAPSAEMAASLRGERSPRDKAERMLREAMGNGMGILADSRWQVDWLREKVGFEAGPPFGGVNLSMFRPAAKTERKRLRVLFSGDPRERKGTDTVRAALAIIEAALGDRVEVDSYWKRSFSQAQLVEFLQQGDLFLDGHRRAGWCNPVAEAMACGTAAVCTEIRAVSDFARHGETALVVPVDDAPAMAEAALRLLEDEALRERLVANGLARIAEYDYRRVAGTLADYLAERVGESSPYG